MLAMSQDVTERNRAEKDRLASEAQLRQSQKMEAVGQLTGGIAHDFNNILSVIIANVEALGEEDNIAPELKRRLDGIGGAVYRAADLTRQLLTFSRKQPLRTQVTKVNDLVAGTVKLLARSLGSQVEIETTLSDGLWPVSIDRPQLESALINLRVNARDALAGRRQASHRDEEHDARRDLCRAEPRRRGRRLYDARRRRQRHRHAARGAGQDVRSVLHHQGGRQGHRARPQHGLWLCPQSAGHLKVESEVGRGTTFRLYLPRSVEVEVAAAAAAPKARPALPRGRERVLVVEDEPGVRSNVVDQLKSLGYDVACAINGAEGLAACASVVKPYDLLLTDVVMPVMNGKLLADAVALRWPKMRIVFMSGYVESAIVHGGNLDEGLVLLSKPFRKGELATTVRQALDAAEKSSTPMAAA